ncbi:hypothetical protein SynSYN20_01496 [Synechococcus sp. SYN20]|nr:hypothetical protein SynSYN20_01496 [Synechococcus sp. SYN20]
MFGLQHIQQSLSKDGNAFSSNQINVLIKRSLTFRQPRQKKLINITNSG